MAVNKRRTEGILTVELIVALAVIGFIIAAMAITLHDFGQFNHYQMARQRCIAAAQAYLDSVALRAQPISDAEAARLWPSVTVTIDKIEGAGRWQGLQLVRATAVSPSGSRRVKVELCRYIAAPGQRAPTKEQ